MSFPRVTFVAAIALPLCLWLTGCGSRTDVEAAATPLPDQLASAWQAFNRGQLPEARQTFTRVLAATSDQPELRVQAQFGLGLSLAHDRRAETRAQAVPVLQLIAQDFPDSPIAPWSILEIGIAQSHLSERLDLNYPADFNVAARASFETVLARYPDSPAAAEAHLRLAHTWAMQVKGPEVDRQINRLADFVTTHPDSPLNTAINTYLGVWYSIPKQDFARAIPFLSAAAEEGLADPFRQSQYDWSVAILYERGLGDLKSARHWYARLIDEAPTSRHAPPARIKLEAIEVLLTSDAPETPTS